MLVHNLEIGLAIMTVASIGLVSYEWFARIIDNSHDHIMSSQQMIIFTVGSGLTATTLLILLILAR